MTPSACGNPYYALDRLAREVCAAELSDLTARLPPLQAPMRRNNDRDRVELLAREAAGGGVSFEAVEPRLLALTAALDELMGGGWWTPNPGERRPLADLYRSALERCGSAARSLLRLAAQHGYPAPLVRRPDDTAPTWDELIERLAEYSVKLPAAAEGIHRQRIEDETAPRKSARRKRSAGHTDTELKIIAALSAHHRYGGDGRLNCDAAGVRQLAQAAEVGRDSVSQFFKRMFKSHKAYKEKCADEAELRFHLRLLNGEVSPKHTYGRRPPAEGRDDE